jgi:hypothetical protein
MFARNSLLMRLAFYGRVARGHEVCVRRPELRRACFDRALELLLVLDQLAISILDLDEHVVEPINQLADLVVPGRFDAQLVAVLSRDGAGGRGQPQERLGNNPLQPGRQQERQAEGAHEWQSQKSKVLTARARISRSDST